MATDVVRASRKTPSSLPVALSRYSSSGPWPTSRLVAITSGLSEATVWSAVTSADWPSQRKVAVTTCCGGATATTDHCGRGCTNGLIQSFHMSDLPKQQEHVEMGSQSETTRNEAFQPEIRCCRPRHDAWRKAMDAALAFDGVAAAAQEIHDVRPPPAVTRITEVI